MKSPLYSSYTIALASLLVAVNIQENQCFQQQNSLLRSHHHHHERRTEVLSRLQKSTATILKVQTEETNTAITDISFTVPKFYDGEIDEGVPYPSPLHTVHVRTLLTDDEASTCYNLSTKYAMDTGCWNQPDLERHSTYSTCDFPVEDNEDLAAYLNDINFDDRLKDMLQDMYGIEPDFMSYLDFFCAHYQAQDDNSNSNQKKTMDRLEAHRDGSLISFSMLLNDPTDFEGGGTFFDGLRDVTDDNGILAEGGVVRPARAGDGTFHSGKLLHGADIITSGTRTVLVGFVDVAPWVIRPGILSNACRDWGRMDVATYQQKRQAKKTLDGKQPGWFLNNARWIYSNPEEGQGRSCLRGFAPKLTTLEHRADPEYQRLKKLQAEDKLLRTILVDVEEMEGFANVFDDGDITIL